MNAFYEQRKERLFIGEMTRYPFPTHVHDLAELIIPTAGTVTLGIDAEKYRLNSAEGETWFEHHLKIDNTNLDPDEVADRVIEAFGLVPREKAEAEYRFGV